MDSDQRVEMTKDEVVKKYGDVNLYFIYYEKYAFYFRGNAPDGTRVQVLIGGNNLDAFYIKAYPEMIVTINTASYLNRISLFRDDREIWRDND